MGFPSIPNVEFKIITGHKSGKREYAISSDGNIWIGNGNKWNKLKPFRIPPRGDWAVTLQRGGCDGAPWRTINELLQEYFGAKDDEDI